MQPNNLKHVVLAAVLFHLCFCSFSQNENLLKQQRKQLSGKWKLVSFEPSYNTEPLPEIIFTFYKNGKVEWSENDSNMSSNWKMEEPDFIELYDPLRKDYVRLKIVALDSSQLIFVNTELKEEVKTIFRRLN